jgi:hypothetical protein
MLKNISWIFHHYFWKVVYLIVEFIVDIHNYIKTMIRNYNSFSNIDYDVHYHPTKSQIKIQPFLEKQK